MKKTLTINRRHFLHKTGAIVSGTAVAGIVGASQPFQALATSSPQPASDPTKRQGQPATPYGQRSAFEQTHRTLYKGTAKEALASFTPLQDLQGMLTPTALHYERHHAGIPEIDPDTHQLLIHGLVKRPLVFSLDDLLRFPSVSRFHFLECSGNSYDEWKKPEGKTVQDSHGLTSCSEWTGVPLSVVLQEVGVQPGARWIVAEAADGAAMTRSLPLDKCLDDVLLAYGQNGEPIRPAHGYPLRLFVPGWEGSINVKWLRRIKVVEQSYQTREETAKYTDLLPDGTARQFTFGMQAKSVITFPSGTQQLSGPGVYEIRGLAWSGSGRIQGVEVSTDAGQTWQQAELQSPVLPKCHTRFRLAWKWNGQTATLQSRCTDETGYVQPTREALIQEVGLHAGYHFNGIQSWRIAADGKVSHA